MPPRLDWGQAAAKPFCSHTHFHVIPTCRHAQNCQTLSTALDAMCNSFNTRPGRYPYHWCNGVLMPPCILRACTRQLVIRLIYSTRPAVDQTALALCWRPGYRVGHSAVLRPSEVISGSYVILSQARKNIIHDFLSAARVSDFMRDKCGDTWRREKSWWKTDLCKGNKGKKINFKKGKNWWNFNC